MRWLLGALFGVALLWCAALLHRGQPLGWDELEYFRATRWVAEGEVPFRDYWEHHTPLQWLVFAPVAWFANGPGVEAVLLLRWAQAALWIATFVLLMRMARGSEPWARWLALLFVLASPSFVRSALEYRVDALGNLCYVGAVALALLRPRWLAVGALLSAAVLANMRLAPLVIVTAVVFFVRDRAAWRMAAGVALVAAAFVGLLFAFGAWEPFVDGVIRYNVDSARLLEVDTFFDALLAPLWSRDIAALALWLLAIAGAVLAWRRPMPELRMVAVLFAASVVTIAMMEVHYEYHFQTTYLLMLPLAALAFERFGRWRLAAVGVAALAIAVNALQIPAMGNELAYQDLVMTEVDRRTQPADAVFDGAGYALRRKPAYRYWFLPTGVRLLASRGKLPPYELERNPPAAIVYNLRVQRWLEIFPRSARYATRHYVPLTRDLWVPGLTAPLAPGGSAAWTAPASGRYAVYASTKLLEHPWLTKPLAYASIRGPEAARYAIPLRALPRASGLRWTIDDRRLAPDPATLLLHRGQRVQVFSTGAQPVGVLVVPEDVTMLCIAPEEEFVF